mmetsp:Transcript_31705/g.43256  ORF Transcript_31705/g.43256 Transcript_31705/m.43256 type:complete len:212 (-) Transcript_31705:2737-3372(-)
MATSATFHMVSTLVSDTFTSLDCAVKAARQVMSSVVMVEEGRCEWEGNGRQINTSRNSSTMSFMQLKDADKASLGHAEGTEVDTDGPSRGLPWLLWEGLGSSSASRGLGRLESGPIEAGTDPSSSRITHHPSASMSRPLFCSNCSSPASNRMRTSLYRTWDNVRSAASRSRCVSFTRCSWLCWAQSRWNRLTSRVLCMSLPMKTVSKGGRM